MPLATVSLALQALARSATPSAAFAPSFRPSRGQTAHSSLVRRPSELGYRSQVMPDASLVDVNTGALSPPHSTIAAPVVATETEEQDANDFDWFKAWHPLLPVEILDREKPIPIELLGMKLVVYNDGAVVNEDGSETGFGPKGDRPANSRRAEGTWRVFADVCPHRRAPLTEGRVEDDGTLLCSYHGWRWHGDGSLKALPHTDSEGELRSVMNNPRSSCNAFPAKVKDGMLFVWPTSGSDARIESELTPINDTFGAEESGVDKNRIGYGSWVFQKIPVSWDYFYENAMSPARLERSHRGSTPDHEPEPTDVTVTKKPTKNGFEITFKEKGGKFEFTDKFSAPGLLSTHTPLGDEGASYAMQLFCSPASPGWVNTSYRQYVIKSEDLKIPPSGRKDRDDQIKSLRYPSFLTNLARNHFVNQDVFDIMSRERRTVSAKSEKEDADRMSDVIIPTHADKSALVFRHWIKTFSKGHIPYRGDLALPPIDKATGFDVYDHSTAYNAMSMVALKNSRNIRSSAIMAAAFLPFWNQLLGPIGTSVLFTVFSGSAFVAHKVVGGLTRIDYKSKND